MQHARLLSAVGKLVVHTASRRSGACGTDFKGILRRLCAIGYVSRVSKSEQKHRREPAAPAVLAIQSRVDQRVLHDLNQPCGPTRPVKQDRPLTMDASPTMA